MQGTAGNMHSASITVMLTYTDWEYDERRNDYTRQMISIRHYAAPKQIKPIKIKDNENEKS